MPTYDYICRACDHEFEHFQSMTAPVLRKCPKCGKSKLERLIGAGAGVLFKGGGFYETDYRSDSYTKAAEAEKKSAEARTTDAAKPGEGATAAKADSKASDKGESKATPTSESVSSDKKSTRRSMAKSSSSRKPGANRSKRK